MFLSQLSFTFRRTKFSSMSFWHKKTEEELKEEELKKEEARKKKEEEQEHKKHHEHHEGGSGIFTTDGKELPKIKGGWDIIGPDSGIGDNEYSG